MFGIGASIVLAAMIVLAPAADGRALSAAPADRPMRGPLAASAFETFYNPFGDPWSGRTAANPSIPVALTPACSRYGPKAGDLSPRPEEIQFMATSNSPLLFEECSFLIDADGGGDPRQKAYIDALKAARPSLKYLAFFEPAIAYFNGNSPPPHHVGATEIAASHPEWVVYIDGQAPSLATRVKHRDEPGVFLYDITNPSFRAFMVQEAIKSMNFHGIDGVVIEQCSDYPLFEASTPPSTAFINSFAQGCVDFLRELKQAAPNRLVFFLSYASLRGIKENRSEDEKDALAYEFYARRADVSDGLIWEDPLGGAKNISVNPPSEVDRKFARFRQVQAYAASPGRDNYVGLVTNTNIQNQSTFGNTNTEEQHQFAKYYLAAYLTQFRGEKSPMLYYTPSPIGEQFRSATSFNDWNLNVGSPTDPPATRDASGEGRYQRNFTLARVFLNGGNEPWQVSLTDRLYTTLDGQGVTSATIPPRSGVIFRAPDPGLECGSRPKVSVTTSRGPAGTLQVSVRAGLGFIQSIQFSDAQGSVIDMPGGPTGSAGGFTYTPSSGTTEVTFNVRRTAAVPVTVPFVVNDACGGWPSFVGGGPNAF